MKAMLKRFVKDESGLETVEWTIMAAVIVLGILTAVGTLKTEIGNVFTKLKDTLVTAQVQP